MPDNPSETGDRKQYVLRVGLSHPALAGMDRESDRGAIADNAFYDIQNARFRGGRYFARGGQVKLNPAAALPNPAIGLFDLTNTGPFAGSTSGTCGSGGPAIWVLGPAVFDGQGDVICDLFANLGNPQAQAVSPTGQLLYLYDAATAGQPQNAWYLVSIGRGPFFARSPGLYSATYTFVAVIPGVFPGLPGGGDIINMQAIGFLRDLTLLAGSYLNVTPFFAGFSFNGSEVVLEYSHACPSGLYGSGAGWSSVQFREVAYWLPNANRFSGLNDTNLGIFSRDINGNYAALTLTPNNTNSTLIPNSGRVDTIGDLVINCSQVFNSNGTDILYLGGWGIPNQSGVPYGPRGLILSWDGTSLKCVRVMETSPATCTPDPTQVPIGTTVWGVTNFYYNQAASPFLWYTYTNSYPTSGCGGVSRFVSRLGALGPGGTFNDNVDNFITDPAFSSVLLGQISFFGPYRGRLFMIGTDITGGAYVQTVMASTDLALSTGWVIESKFSPIVAGQFSFGPPTDLLVF
jgi:hypothetical protein